MVNEMNKLDNFVANDFVNVNLLDVDDVTKKRWEASRKVWQTLHFKTRKNGWIKKAS